MKIISNARFIGVITIIILILLLTRQCNKVADLKREYKRVENNNRAKSDSIRKYKIDKETTRHERLGLELKIGELNKEYSYLLGKFKTKDNPKTVVITEYEIRDSIREVPVYVTVDTKGNKTLSFTDSLKINTDNYRYVSGTIPYSIYYDSKDSTYKINPKRLDMDLNIGMNLDIGVFKDKDGVIKIKTDTDYPNVTFTALNGAYVLDSPENKKTLRALRKTFGLGLSLGYGISLGKGGMQSGLYVGIGLNYTPKFLQF